MIGAFRADGDRVSRAGDALVGLLLLTRPNLQGREISLILRVGSTSANEYAAIGKVLLGQVVPEPEDTLNAQTTDGESGRALFESFGFRTWSDLRAAPRTPIEMSTTGEQFLKARSLMRE